MTEPIVVLREGPVAKLTLNRPGVFNAMNFELLDRLADVLTGLACDDDVRAIVLSGAGQAFCGGGDLKWILEHAPGPGAAVHVLAGRLHASIIEIRRMERPVIAAVNGPAAGAGLSLALACDLRVMARGAVLHQAYTSRGLSLDGGGSFALPRLVGLARALEIAALDEPIDSEQALAWGLVTRVVEDERVVDSAVELASRLASRSIHAFGAAKQLLTDSLDTPLEAQLERERAALRRCAEHPDGREGLAAFAEKRAPAFVR